MNIFKYCLIFTVVAVFAAACSQAGQAPNKPTANVSVANNPAMVDEVTPDPPSAPVGELAQGKELYATNCMICHKDTGKGGKVTIEGKSINPDDLSSEKMKKNSDEKMFKNVLEGAPDDGMPAFKGKLTDDEVKAIIKHIRTLQSS